MRYLLLPLFFYISSLQLKAQVPQSGVYQFNKNRNNFFGASHYSGFFNSIDDFLSLKVVPYKGVTDYGLEYAIVAVNKEHTQLKVAFLRDTVSTAGKQVFATIIKNIPTAKDAYFAKEFSIQKDSVTTSSNYGNPLKSSEDLQENWFFSKSGYDYFGIYKNPLIKNLSIKDSLSGKYQNGKNYQFEQAFFVWRGKRPLPYLDLRFNESKDKILIYDQPKSNAVVKDYFRKGEYIAITADSSEWYGIDRIEVVRKDTKKKYYTMDSGMQEGTTFLQTTSGWIRKEDLVTDPWVKQKQQTKLFRFEISADEESLKAVKIIHKKTGKQQVFLDIWAELKSNPVNVIQVSDYNFDGYPDFMFLMQTGGAGPNDTHNFYLYNPKSGNFEYNDELSQLPQVQIDPKSQTISSNWRDGAAHHGGEKYAFINQQLTKIAYWDQYASMGFFAQESSGELINGKWVDHHYKGAEVLYPATAMYHSPDALTIPTDTVSKGDYALIKDENSLFFYTEITKANNHLIKGWVAKESFLPVTKSMYTENTPLYYFELIKDNRSTPIAVKVSTKSNRKTVQFMTDMDDVDSTINTLYPAVTILMVYQILL
ncbi:XAC2610-related protein [Pedobacter sp. NJ-S-72]